MDTIKKNTLLFLIISFIIAFFILIAILYLYYTRRLDNEIFTVTSYRNSFIFNKTLTQSFVLLPSVVIFVYVASFSIFFTLSSFRRESFAYSSIAAPSYAALIFFLILIIASELLIIPILFKKREVIKYSSKKAQSVLLYAQELYRKNDYENALSILDIYLEIDEKNEKANKLYNTLVDRLSEVTYRSELTIEEKERSEKDLKAAPISFYERGKEEYTKKNYYSALFYLERALSLHSDNREIRDLYERCKSKAENQLGAMTKKEKETRMLIQQKERALSHLDNEEFYEAYKIFMHLNEKYPELEDLNLYLETVKKELLKVDFLPQELKNHEWLPSINNIIFIDKGGFFNTVESIIPSENNFYFYNIMRYKAQNDTVERQYAKYGKWMDNKIKIKNEEEFVKVPEGKEDLHYIHPFIHPGYLLYINDRESILNQLTIYERFSVFEDLRRSGLDIEDKFTYLSKKLGIFFSVYVLSLFISALAWKKRSIYKFPPVLKLFFFAIITPFVVYFLHLIYTNMNDIIIYTHRYFTRFVMEKMNVVVYTALINTVFALIATLYFLSQRSSAE